MDIASKLKFASWTLIVCLWGIFMLQYSSADKYRNALGIGTRSTYGKKPVVAKTKKKSSFNPFIFLADFQKKHEKARKTANANTQGTQWQVPMKPTPDLSIPKANIKIKDSNTVGVSTFSAYDYSVPVSTAFYSSDMSRVDITGGLKNHDSSMPTLNMPEGMQLEAKPVSQKPFESFKHEITSENRPHKVKPLSKDIAPEDYSAPPPGFQQKITKHFVLYEEGEVSAVLEKKANEIHSNIMLDLAEFKPWEREKIVFIYYAHSASSYRKISGRPAWSGGAASLDTRSIFLYKAANNSFGILAHELTHMYFDSFFPPKHPSPLWLSEGMAIYIQTERSNEKPPNWIKEYVDKVRKGSKYSFQVLTTVDDLEGTKEEDIRIWYAEAYLLTKYLMTVNGMKAFYSFCNYLKMGFTLEQSVKMAYRLDLKVVEENWRLKMQQDAASGK